MNFRSLLCKFSIAVGFLIVFTQCSLNKEIDGVLLGNGHNSDYTIIEKYWKLIVINGKPIVFSEREPYIILKQEENKVIGFGACNPLNAKYELSPKNKISFFKSYKFRYTLCRNENRTRFFSSTQRNGQL